MPMDEDNYANPVVPDYGPDVSALVDYGISTINQDGAVVLDNPQQPEPLSSISQQTRPILPVLIDDVKRDTGELRRNEYCILIHVYRQLLAMSPEVRANYGGGLRDQLANLTGVGFSTAQKAMKFSKMGYIPVGPSRVGRKQKVLDEDYAEKIKEIVRRKNRAGEMVSAIQIKDELKNEYNTDVTLTMLRRDMIRLGMRWEQGSTTRQSTWRSRGGWSKRKKTSVKGQETSRLGEGSEQCDGGVVESAESYFTEINS